MCYHVIGVIIYSYPSGNFLFHACLKKHACHSIVSIVLYAFHMQYALKTFKIPACYMLKNMPVTCRDLGHISTSPSGNASQIPACF